MALSKNYNEPIEIQIDKAGRVVIPKKVRERLNLQPGTTLALHIETDDYIALKVVEEDPPTFRENGVLVIGGEWTGDPSEDLIKKDRDDRIQKILNPES